MSGLYYFVWVLLENFQVLLENLQVLLKSYIILLVGKFFNFLMEIWLIKHVLGEKLLL